MATVSVLRRPERASCSSSRKPTPPVMRQPTLRPVLPRITQRCAGHVISQGSDTHALNNAGRAVDEPAEAFTGAARGKEAPPVAPYKHGLRGSPGGRPDGHSQLGEPGRSGAISWLCRRGISLHRPPAARSSPQQQRHRNSDGDTLEVGDARAATKTRVAMGARDFHPPSERRRCGRC